MKNKEHAIIGMFFMHCCEELNSGKIKKVKAKTKGKKIKVTIEYKDKV